VNENIAEFEGFFTETLDFFKQLKSNNNKEWFDSNRKNYEDYVLNPAKSFITAMGKKLAMLVPTINADPRTNKSLFRINRDTRFSNDKSPYKTNVGIVFWDGNLPRMESSVFYFHLEDVSIMLGAGIYMFNKPQLQKYRESVINERLGNELLSITEELKSKGYSFGGKNYKKVPVGYEALNKNSELLLFNGFYADKSFDIPEEFYSKDFIDFCFDPYSEMLPVWQWLTDLNRRL